MILLVVFFVVMFLLFGVRNIQEDTFESVIVVGEDTAWVLRNRRWLYLRSGVSRQKLDGENFHIFDDNKELGVYNIQYDHEWLVQDKRGNAVSISGNLLAYRANYQMTVLPYEETQATADAYVKTVLKENELDENSEFSSIYKIPVDFDGDGLKEEFYIISNAFPLDFETTDTFSIAFMVKEGTIYYLYTDITRFSSLNACKPYYRSFIDSNYDGVAEVILSCGRYSATERVDMLYQFENNQFKLLISNQ